ncbi:DgyrCDS12909 [Dimorphilus gyrociliatus]|uniref:DgyrCDS12909 n=1 Tax=Dimorphilus gyrociliatus TaxID=2664684 RepID=A0A7I8W938_9ANNE|nr:DgyrCDS12909 [Dimorphilus gyrociliatus]
MDQFQTNTNRDSLHQAFLFQPVTKSLSSSSTKIISDIPASSTSQLRIEKKGTNAWRENGEYKVEVPFQLFASGSIPNHSVNQDNLQQNQLQSINLQNSINGQNFRPISSRDSTNRQSQQYGSNVVYVTSSNELNRLPANESENIHERNVHITEMNKGAPHAYTGIPPTIEMHINQKLRVNCPNNIESTSKFNTVNSSNFNSSNEMKSGKIVKNVQINEPIMVNRNMNLTESFGSQNSSFRKFDNSQTKTETITKNIRINKKPSMKKNTKIIVKRRSSDVVDFVNSSTEDRENSEYNLSDNWNSFLPKASPINPSNTERQEILRLLYGAPSTSIKQSINVEREEEEITGSVSSFDPLLNFDTVSEKVDLCFENGIAKLQVKVRCERVVPIEGSENLFKKSSVIVTRLIDIDLEVTPERRKLLETILSSSTERSWEWPKRVKR